MELRRPSWGAPLPPESLAPIAARPPSQDVIGHVDELPTPPTTSGTPPIRSLDAVLQAARHDKSGLAPPPANGSPRPRLLDLPLSRPLAAPSFRFPCSFAAAS